MDLLWNVSPAIMIREAEWFERRSEFFQEALQLKDEKQFCKYRIAKTEILLNRYWNLSQLPIFIAVYKVHQVRQQGRSVAPKRSENRIFYCEYSDLTSEASRAS